MVKAVMMSLVKSATEADMKKWTRKKLQRQASDDVVLKSNPIQCRRQRRTAESFQAVSRPRWRTWIRKIMKEKLIQCSRQRRTREVISTPTSIKHKALRAKPTAPPLRPRNAGVTVKITRLRMLPSVPNVSKTGAAIRHIHRNNLSSINSFWNDQSAVSISCYQVVLWKTQIRPVLGHILCFCTLYWPGLGKCFIT